MRLSLKFFKIQLLLIACIIPVHLSAGGLVVGNGGNIINCNDAHHEQNNMPVDLYELDHTYGYTHHYDLSQSYEARLLTYLIFEKLDELNKDFSFYMIYHVLVFEITSEPKDQLPFSNDISAKLPDGCHAKTVILQINQDPLYEVSKDFQGLRDLYKVVLRTHEAIYHYSLVNNPGLTSSDDVRRLTAYLFSEDFFSTKDPTHLNKLIDKLNTH